MFEPEKILYNTLKSYSELESPQINSFNPLDKKSISTFSFHFKNLDNESDIYLTLIRLVENFVGDLPWVMHSYGSKKNYTIEPLEIYFLKRKHGVGYHNFLSHATSKKIAELSRKDTIKLSEFIKKETWFK